MGCTICGRESCTSSFHSIAEQETHEAMQAPGVREEIEERDTRIAALEAELARMTAAAKAAEVAEGHWMKREAEAQAELARGRAECESARHLAERWYDAAIQSAQLRAELADVRAECDALREACDQVGSLIRETRGVDGLHLNGDVAPWSEITSGGRFESWLPAFTPDGAVRWGEP